MGVDAKKDVESGSYPRLVLPSLVLSRFIIQSPSIVLGLLMIDIGVSFGLPVGIMGQISTAASLFGFVACILMGVLSVRFRHRSLILAGLGLRVASAIGCYYVQGYDVMLVVYALNGLGTARARAASAPSDRGTVGGPFRWRSRLRNGCSPAYSR